MAAQAGEADIIRKAQAGDTQAFAALVQEHQAFVYNLALRALADPEAAQDTAQEAFVRAWRALPGFRLQSSFRTWLYRITLNLCFNRRPALRQALAALPIEDLEAQPGDQVPVQRQVEERDLQAFLYKQIDALPPAYRLMVLMRYQMDLPYEEIAAALSVPIGTVKTGLHRARARLRDSLHNYEELSEE